MSRIKKYKNPDTGALFYVRKKDDEYIAGLDSRFFMFSVASPSLMAAYSQEELKDIYENKAI